MILPDTEKVTGSNPVRPTRKVLFAASGPTGYRASADRARPAGARFLGLFFRGSFSALLRVGAFLVEPGLVYEYDRLHAVAEAELLEDVRDVGLYGRLADVELLTDLRVGQAAGDEQEDVLLSCGELV